MSVILIILGGRYRWWRFAAVLALVVARAQGPVRAVLPHSLAQRVEQDGALVAHLHYSAAQSELSLPQLVVVLFYVRQSLA